LFVSPPGGGLSPVHVSDDDGLGVFVRPKVRSMISDFAVFLTIVLMVLLDYVIGVPTQKLQVPSKFQVSSSRCSRAGVGKLRPAGHMRPVALFNPARRAFTLTTVL